MGLGFCKGGQLPLRLPLNAHGPAAQRQRTKEKEDHSGQQERPEVAPEPGKGTFGRVDQGQRPSIPARADHGTRTQRQERNPRRHGDECIMQGVA
jgi:hypothetical protein